MCHVHSPAPFSCVPGSVFACTVCRVEKRERKKERVGGGVNEVFVLERETKRA